MSEHPCRETLEGFLLNRLPSREVKATVTHLLGGCEHCRGEMSTLATAMFAPAAVPELQLSADEEAAYDRAVSAAFATALEHERSLRLEREAGEQQAEEILRNPDPAEMPVLP